MSNKPNLVVMAGPNGAGKTTITKKLLSHPWLDNTTYINPDEIANEKFGGWNNKESFIEAANLAEQMRENCLENKKNLAFKTVFSTDGKIEFIQKAIKNNFFVRFFFIATDDAEINIGRISSRLLQYGHDVPPDKVKSRHYKSIANCVKVINLVNRAYIYDNSIDGKDHKLIFRVVNDENIQTLKQYVELHDWTKNIYKQCYIKKLKNNAKTNNY